MFSAPLIITVNKIDKEFVLDADVNEEICSTSYLFVGVKSSIDKVALKCFFYFF